jgi:hypothetical protein
MCSFLSEEGQKALGCSLSRWYWEGWLYGVAKGSGIGRMAEDEVVKTRKQQKMSTADSTELIKGMG